MPCNRIPGTGNTIPERPFVNWAETVQINPQQIFQPTTLDQLVAIVKQAEASNPPLGVHAVGSGWSFEAVMVTPDYLVETLYLNHKPEPKFDPPANFNAPPIDYGSTHQDHPIVNPVGLGTLSETMTGTQYPDDPVFGALTPAAIARRNLCHVEAGIKIADLYTVLEGIAAANPAITTSDQLWHGYGVKTLGGSGGQAIVGAISTGVHGGDDHDPNGNPIRPLPDMVQGIRLVGAGGTEYFIQRGGDRAIVDPVLLAQLDPCLAGHDQIITDDDTFNAVVVSVGRMGIIYSVVLEVRPQYFLFEVAHSPSRWKQLSSSVLAASASGHTIGDFRADVNTRFLNVVVLPYASWEQNAIGSNTTASTPFVVADPGGDPKSLRRLARWTQTNTASGVVTKMGYKWPPPPTISLRSLFVQRGTWIYFRGTDIDPSNFRTEPGALWKVRDDGTQLSGIGSNITASSPFVVPDPNGAWVYFQGTDNALWKVRDDGSQQSHIGENSSAGKQYTASTPFVVPNPGGGAWIYYQTPLLNQLRKIRDDGTQLSQIAGNTTASSPFVVPDSKGAWVYFRGTDNALWKVRDDGSQQSHIGENTSAGKQYTASTPFVVPNPSGGAWIYYQGTPDNALWKIRDDGTQQSHLGENTTAGKQYTASSPFVVPDPNGGAWVYYQGTDNTLWKIRDDGTQQVNVGGNTTASPPFVVPDANGDGGAWVYFRGTDVGLNNPWGPGTLWKVRADSDHTCTVTTRSETAPTPPIVAAPSVGNLIFNYACELPPAGLVAWTAAVIAALEGFAAGTAVLLSLIPFVGPILAGIDVAAANAVVSLLSPLLVPGTTIGTYLAKAENVLTSLGLTGLASNLVNQIIGGNLSPGKRTDVSFRIMDTVDYKQAQPCYKALAVEVGFNADDTAYVSYINSIFSIIENFQKQSILYGGYISLRYCAGSDALLAMEQWPHTVCIEFGALAHLAHEKEVLKAFEDETANHIGADGRFPTVHWGQLNSRTAEQIKATFPSKIDRWRSALARLSANGSPTTFDNDFCKKHGLELS